VACPLRHRAGLARRAVGGIAIPLAPQFVQRKCLDASLARQARPDAQTLLRAASSDGFHPQVVCAGQAWRRAVARKIMVRRTARPKRWIRPGLSRPSAVGGLTCIPQEFASHTSKAESEPGDAGTRTSTLSWGWRRPAGSRPSRKPPRPRGTEDLIIFLLRAPLEEASKRATNSMACADPGRVTACPGPVLSAPSCEVSGLSPHSQHGAAPSCSPQWRCAVRIDDPNVAGEPCSFPQRSASDRRPAAVYRCNHQKLAAPRAQTSLQVSQSIILPPRARS
jgi:hypothetical protein